MMKIVAFLWNGDRNARPIQRVGLFLFAFLFLYFDFIVLSGAIENNFGDHWILIPVVALVVLFASLRLFRNAFLRSSKYPSSNQPNVETPNSHEHLE